MYTQYTCVYYAIKMEYSEKRGKEEAARHMHSLTHIHTLTRMHEKRGKSKISNRATASL